MRKHLLIIGFVWPEPKSSAAGSRMMQLIEAFQQHNFQITFASPCAKSDNAFDLTTISVLQMTIELNNASFDAFVKNLNPEIVVFDRFMMEEQFGWRVAEQCSNALRILDTEDLQCLRKGRQLAFKEGNTFDKNYLFSDIAKREIASIYRCDLSLIISEAEIDILKHDFKVDDSLLLYLPFMLEELSDEAINQFPSFETRQHFITIGNFLHEPNYNSVLYLKETIWPLIKKELPDVELHIYGSYASQKVNQLNNKNEDFLIKGFAEDAHNVMQKAKVCLAPLRFGAGLKGKLIDAMQNGTPCIMTTIAAEGMFGSISPSGFVENTSEKFAKKAIELYTNKPAWLEFQTNGFNAINSRFNKAEFQTQLIKVLQDISDNLQQHRLNNFTGQLLQHHTHQSTKYMSKWIEEKNNNNNS